jgi:metal-dependent amidase/aminoacylase/carboxypeptidase family protein
LTVGAINAGATHNAIPDQATILGTLRTTRPQDTELVQKRMDSVIAGVAQATGCEIGMEFPYRCPSTENDPRIVKAIAEIGCELLGQKAVRWLDAPSMGGEDFAFYQELIPGAFIRLGAALSDGRPRRPLHSSLFDIDENALPVGTNIMIRSALHLAQHYDKT